MSLSNPCVIVFALGIAASTVIAQPATSDLPAFERGGGEPVAPLASQPIGTGLLDARLSSLPPDFDVPGAQVVPEGTYLPRVVGRAVRTARGEVVFAPDRVQPVENSVGLPSPLPLMVLLPSARRDQLALALADDPLGINAPAEQPAIAKPSDPRPYAVGGQVYVYHGRSYLLCTTFTAISSKPDKEATAPTDDPAKAQDSAVDLLIHDLERAGDERRILTPGATSTSARRRDKSDDGVAAATTDGSVITNRRGRLIRSAEEGGRLVFVVDNDPDSPAMPQLVLLPCQVLEEVESVVAARGPDLSVRLSGRVVASGNKASLLPVFFQVERRADITPGQ